MNRSLNARIIICLTLLFFPTTSWGKDSLRIVASIPPVYALVSEITQGVTQPALLVKGNTSPHHYTFTPSNASILSKADIIFYISNDMETFLQKPLRHLGKAAVKIPLAEAKGITLLPNRNQLLWEGHGHGESHHHGRYDMHIWLSPANAKAMLREITKRLSAYDPGHKADYAENMNRAIKRLDAVDVTIKHKLLPYKNTHFLVFHDAYQYFEHYYGLHSVGALMLSSDIPLSARNLNDITKSIKAHEISCMFTEPQFDPKHMQILAERSGAGVGVLNPLGNGKINKRGYGKLLDDLAKSMVQCFNTAKESHAH